MYHFSFCSFIFLSLLTFTSAKFGYDTHKVSAAITEAYLTQNTFSRILQITGNQTLVEIATWADEIRGNPKYSWSASLHYVNPEHDPLNNICSYDDERDCKNDFCVTAAVRNFTEQLTEGGGSQGEQEDAVKFLTHFVADMHQPLHVCGIQKGGNDYDVRFFGKNTNLHKVWDSDIALRVILTEMDSSVDNYIQFLLKKLNSEWQDEIPEWLSCVREKEEMHIWSSSLTVTCPEIWAIEIEKINCSNIWSDLTDDLTEEYYEKNKDLVGKLLAQAGIRLATTLNSIFDPEAKNNQM